MTISSIVPVNNYTGNSSSTTFDFDFLIERSEELIVTHIDKYGNSVILKEDVDYTINEINNKEGSYINFPIQGSSYKVLSEDEKISLALALEIKQESEFKNSSYFNFNILEWTFDYIVRILQILNRKIDRCLKVNEGTGSSSDELMNQLNESSIAAVNAADMAVQAKNSAENKLQNIEQKITQINGKITEFDENFKNSMKKIEDVGIETRANIDLDNLSEDGNAKFNSKLDADLSNLSNSKRLEITASLIPDFSSGISYKLKSERDVYTYTCPAKGLLHFMIGGFNSNYGYLKINNIEIFKFTTGINTALIGSVGNYYVEKGDLIEIKSGYSVSYLSQQIVTFYPLKIKEEEEV